MTPTDVIDQRDIDLERSTAFVVTPWWEPRLATSGVDPRDPYVERFWLPVLGPSTVLLLRRFARGFEEQPTGFRVGVLDTSLALGLGRGTGRSSPIMRTVERAATFGMLRHSGEGRIEVRTHMPLLAPRHVRQLTPVLRRLHGDWVTSRERTPDPGRPDVAQPTGQSRQAGRTRQDWGSSGSVDA